MNFYEIIGNFSTNFWIYGGTFVFVLSLLIFVHEWGHYIVARLCGVRVETFSIGFGKEIIGRNDKHGTRWKLCWVPLGGYVKLFGDVDPASSGHTDKVEDQTTQNVRTMTPSERSVAFFAKPVRKRAAIVAAGPAINYIFAIILLAGLFMFNGQPVTPPLAGAIIGGSSADKAGFQPQDRILSINGGTVRDFDEIRRQMTIGLDKPNKFIVERGGREITINATPQKVELEDRFGFKHSRGLLGLISPSHAIDIKNIVSINGVAYSTPEKVLATLGKRMNTQFQVGIKGAEETEILTVRPMAEDNAVLKEEGHAHYGLLFLSKGGPNEFVKYAPLPAVKEALLETWSVTKGTLESLGQIVVGTRSASELGGVIRIGALAGDMAQQGLVAFVLFAALLSINLGLINLFPIPLLDGGHLVFYAFEAALGRPIPERIQEYAFRFGLAFLVSIMVFANLNDIMQIIL
ncbi:MAG: RIP metalloprotease RseP [Alphaproteobacteria bacterium]